MSTYSPKRKPALLVILLTAIAIHGAMAAEPALRIVSAEWMPAHEFFPGGVRLWVKNTTDRRIVKPVCRVWDGGRKVSTKPMDIFCVKLTRPIIGAREEAEIEIQFQDQAKRKHVLVELQDGKEPLSSLEIPLAKPPFRIDGVRVDPYMRKVYAYVKNESAKVVYGTKAGFGRDKDRQPKEPLTIAPGETAVLVARVSTDTEKGEFADVRVTICTDASGKNPVVLRRMVRVINGFPIQATGTLLLPEIGLDPKGFYDSVKRSPDLWHHPELDHIPGADFVQAPGSLPGGWSKATHKVITLRQKLFVLWPSRPTKAWMSRFRAPESVFRFIPFFDSSAVAPNVPPYHSSTWLPGPSPFLELATAYFKAADLTHAMAAVDIHKTAEIVHATFDTGPTTEELRFMAWNGISAGAHGVVFRGSKKTAISHVRAVAKSFVAIQVI